MGSPLENPWRRRCPAQVNYNAQTVDCERTRSIDAKYASSSILDLSTCTSEEASGSNEIIMPLVGDTVASIEWRCHDCPWDYWRGLFVSNFAELFSAKHCCSTPSSTSPPHSLLPETENQKKFHKHQASPDLVFCTVPSNLFLGALGGRAAQSIIFAEGAQLRMPSPFRVLDDVSTLLDSLAVST